jgi:hypothetical protein
MNMLQRRSLGPRLVLVCLGLWSLANVRLVLNAVRMHGDPDSTYTPSVMIPRFEPLRQWLPDDVETGYLLDEEHADLQTHHPGSRFSLALYALSPRIIRPTTDCPLVIVDGDRPETPPKIAQQQGWTLVADLHNGVRLYSTPRRTP